MNVIISNKYQMLLANLDIQVLDNINGVFTVEDIITRYKNYFYNKMILDITALKDYENINTLQRLSISFDMNKIILLLDDSPKVNSGVYLSQLVSMGIYNFTKNIDQIEFLIDNPNTYRDVASFHKLNGISEDSKDDDESDANYSLGQKVIGIKNVTEHAGSTTLTYLLKKHLEKSYKVKALELANSDFKYFNDSGMNSVTDYELSDFISNNSDADVILVDIPMNNGSENYCTDVIYLIETGFIQLNKLISSDSLIFEKLKNKKIVLNKCALNDSDISVFENESGSKVFFTVPYVNDKDNNLSEINNLLSALGFTRIEGSGSGKKGFNLFK